MPKGPGGVRASHAGGRARWRWTLVALTVLVAALAVPISSASASAQSRRGIRTGREGRDDHLADRPARLEPGDEGRAARVDRRVQQARWCRAPPTPSSRPTSATARATRTARSTARVRWSTTASSRRSTTSRSTTRPAWSTCSRRRASRASESAEPTSPSSGRASRSRSRPASIAAYLGTAVGFKQDGNTKICLMRTDAPTGADVQGLPHAVVHRDRRRHHL